MTQKLILLDIDGTLFNEQKQVSASAQQAVRDLQKAGHRVAFATGRAPFTFKKLMHELKIDTYVGLNGQYVEHRGEVIYKHPLSMKIVEELGHYAEKADHPIIYLGHDNWYSNGLDHPYIQKAMVSLKVERQGMYDPAYYRKGDVYQVLLFCSDGDEIQYESEFKKHFQFIRWHDYTVDVIPASGSKAVGIEQLIQHLQFSPENVYAFGDGRNDIAMLQTIQNSVAMGNASEEVKQAASAVTGHVNEDGLLHGLQMVGLLD